MRIVVCAGILMAALAAQAGVLNPKAIPPTRKKLNAPGQPQSAMSPEARQRMSEAMKQNWAARGAKPKAQQRLHTSHPVGPQALPNR
jgi:hypothetical protein